MDGWNTSFLFGWPIFRGYVSFRECKVKIGGILQSSPSFTNAGWWNTTKVTQMNSHLMNPNTFFWVQYILRYRAPLKRLRNLMILKMDVICLFWVLTSTLSWKVKCISMRPLTQPPGFWAGLWEVVWRMTLVFVKREGKSMLFLEGRSLQFVFFFFFLSLLQHGFEKLFVWWMCVLGSKLPLCLYNRGGSSTHFNSRVIYCTH